jgi:hypothetical protein
VKRARVMSPRGEIMLDKPFPFTYHTRTCAKVRCVARWIGNMETGVA